MNSKITIFLDCRFLVKLKINLDIQLIYVENISCCSKYSICKILVILLYKFTYIKFVL